MKTDMLYSFDIPNLLTEDELTRLKQYAQNLHEKGLYLQPQDTDLNTLLDEYRGHLLDDTFFKEKYEPHIIASWNRNSNNIAIPPTKYYPQEVSDFIQEISARYGASGAGQGFFAMMRKDQDIVPHVDLDWRKSNIMIPLSDNYAPLQYYDEDMNVLINIDYSDRVILTNTTVMHGVKNIGYERFTFQISFEEDMQTTLKNLQALRS